MSDHRFDQICAIVTLNVTLLCVAIILAAFLSH